MVTSLQLRDRIGQLALIAAFLFLARAQWRGYQVSGQIAGLVYLALVLLVVVMALIRRPPKAVAAGLMARVVASLGSYLPLFFRPGGDPLVPEAVSVAMISLGGLLAIVGLLSLRRSFGIVAADRGVVDSGLYSLVRHPLYAGYLLSHVGYVLSSPTPWNLACWLVADGCQIARIHYEEALLRGDPRYVQYLSRVRWRLVPGVF